MSQRITTLTEAVKDDLNASSDFPEITAATRVYVPKIELTQTATLTTLVAGVESEKTRAARKIHTEKLAVHVGLFKKFVEMENSDVDTMVDLLLRVRDYFLEMTRFSGSRIVSVETDPMYDLDHMERLRQFSGVVVVTFEEDNQI